MVIRVKNRPRPINRAEKKTDHYISGSSGLEGGAKKHEIYAATIGGHLFYDLFLQGRGNHGPLDPPPDPLLHYLFDSAQNSATGSLTISGSYRDEGGAWNLWLVHTARDRERDSEWETMGFCIILCTVHTTQEQGQEEVPIVFYCALPVPVSFPVPCRV